MRKKIIANSLLGLGLSLNVSANSPSVAVDIAPIHSLVSQVMDGVGTPDLIIPAEASPHGYSMRPSQAKALAEADLVFWMGEELTPWLDKAMTNVASSAEKLALLDTESTTTYPFREGATFEGHAHHDDHDKHHEKHGHHDGHDEHHEEHGHDDDHDKHHAEHGHHDSHDKHHKENGHHDDHADHDKHDHHDDHGPGLIDRFLSLFGSHDHEEEHHDEHDDHSGHGHEGIDPHAWLDPVNAKAWITEIKNALSKKDPANAQKYEQNAIKAIAELDKLIEETNQQIKALGDLQFVVFHDAYQYFEKRFGISAAGSISLSDAEDPSPVRVQEIKNTVTKLGVNCVFAEPQYDAGIVNNVFEGSSIAAIGVIDPLGAAIQAGSDHYSKLIQGMVKSLSQCKK